MNYFQDQTVNVLEGNPNITEVLSIKKIGQETGLQEPTVVPRLKPCFQAFSYLRPSILDTSLTNRLKVPSIPSHNGFVIHHITPL